MDAEDDRVVARFGVLASSAPEAIPVRLTLSFDENLNVESFRLEAVGELGDASLKQWCDRQKSAPDSAPTSADDASSGGDRSDDPSSSLCEGGQHPP